MLSAGQRVIWRQWICRRGVDRPKDHWATVIATGSLGYTHIKTPTSRGTDKIRRVRTDSLRSAG